MSRSWRRCAALVLALALAAHPVTAQVVEYYHLDALGSVRAVTNQAAQVVERHDFLPFGEECTTAPCAVGLPGTNTFKFTGKEQDPESGLGYFGARYQASRLGRFTSVDPAMDPQAFLSDPQRWNRYAYGLNQPLRYVDPDGRVAKDFTGAQLAQFQRDAAAAGPVDLPLWLEITLGAGVVLAAAPVVWLAAEALPGLAATAIVAAANPRVQQAVVHVAEGVAGVPGTPMAALPMPSRVPNAGGAIRSFVTSTDEAYYRVFSGDATRGAYLSRTLPGSRALAVEGFALPPANTAEFYQRVMVPAGTRLQRSRALGAFDRRGGLEQFELLQEIPNENFGPGVPFR